MCVECVDGGSTFPYSTWRVFEQEGQGEESWEGPRSDTDLSHALCISLYQGPVLEENLGRNQSAEKDKYPRATDWASGQVTTAMLCCPPRSRLRMEKTKIRYPGTYGT